LCARPPDRRFPADAFKMISTRAGAEDAASRVAVSPADSGREWIVLPVRASSSFPTSAGKRKLKSRNRNFTFRVYEQKDGRATRAARPSSLNLAVPDASV
jgi:hypothetical protein